MEPSSGSRRRAAQSAALLTPAEVRAEVRRLSPAERAHLEDVAWVSGKGCVLWRDSGGGLRGVRAEEGRHESEPRPLDSALPRELLPAAGEGTPGVLTEGASSHVTRARPVRGRRTPLVVDSVPRPKR